MATKIPLKQLNQEDINLSGDHRSLNHKDAKDQHPISAITGLEEILDSIPIPMTANQLRKILMEQEEVKHG